MTLSYAGLEYYKSEEPLGFIPISDIVCASPVAGGGNSSDGINANISVSTRNGDVYDFELVGGESQVNLWLDQIDLYTDAAANDGIGEAGDSDFEDEQDAQGVESEEPFRMGWLLKQPTHGLLAAPILRMCRRASFILQGGGERKTPYKVLSSGV